MQGYVRHVWFYAVVRNIVRWPVERMFRFQGAPAPVVDEPYIVIANHNTDFDMIFVGISFPRHMYFVASEHIFRTGWMRKLLVYFFDPIPKRKGGADATTALQMVRRLRKGSNVALFAEGNKSFQGATCPVHPATGSMVKASGAALVTYRLEGGYFSSPRWAHTLRRGKMRGYVVRTYSSQTISGMTAEEVNTLIARDIDEDAYRRQEERPVPYRGKKLAEGIQNVLYVCPRCHAFGTVHGKDDQVKCSCGLTATYTETGYLRSDECPFDTLEAWGQWQRDYLTELFHAHPDQPLFADANQTILRIFPDHRTQEVACGTLTFGGNGLNCGDFHVDMQDLQGLEIYGKNTIVFSAGEQSRYQVLSAMERSGLKYFEAFEMMRKERG